MIFSLLSGTLHVPRTARLDTPGLLHRIMIRGIERRKIFNDDKKERKRGQVLDACSVNR